MLFLLHARCRRCDGMHVSEEPVLEDLLLEGRTGHYNTSSAKGRRGQWLPLVGYASGISGLVWAANWLQVRPSCGLGAGPERPLMPHLSSGGVLTNDRMNIDDGNSAVRCVLMVLGLNEINSNYGTHGMKTKTMIAYPRDALDGPLARPEQAYFDIRHGRFLPGSSMSGRLVKAAAVKPAKEVEVPAPSTSNSSSSSSSDSTPVESGEAGADRTVMQLEIMATKKSVKKKKNNLPDDVVVWRHRLRK